MGDSALEEEEDVVGPSSHLEVVAGSRDASWSSYVGRRERGRRVAELLTEAVADHGLLMFIAAGPGFGVQAALTFGSGEIISAK